MREVRAPFKSAMRFVLPEVSVREKNREMNELGVCVGVGENNSYFHGYIVVLRDAHTYLCI